MTQIAKFHYSSLGRDLSRLMANPSSANPETHVAGSDLYHRLGGNCLYLHGEGDETHSRQTTGRWLRERGLRDHFFLTTQACHDGWDEVNSRPIDRFTSEAVLEDVARDLELLQTDRIDLVGLADRPLSPVEPVLIALAGEIAVGRVGNYGLSSWSADRVQQAIDCANRRGLPCPAALFTTELALPRATESLWPEYPSFDSQLQEIAERHSLTVLAHVEDFNLGQCLFMEKESPPPWRAHWIDRWDHLANESLVRRVQSFAAARGLTTREVNLSYVLNQPFPVIGIVSLPTLLNDRGGEYVRASGVRLSEDELRSLRGG